MATPATPTWPPLADIFHRLRYWMGRHEIQTDGVTVILNFTDRAAAAAFETAFNQERVDNYMFLRPTDGHGFEMHGIKVLVESPIHEASQHGR